MHELAPEGGGVEPAGEVVGESGEDAFAHLVPHHAPLGHVETLGACYGHELLEEGPDLARALGVNPQAAAGLHE